MMQLECAVASGLRDDGHDDRDGYRGNLVAVAPLEPTLSECPTLSLSGLISAGRSANSCGWGWRFVCHWRQQQQYQADRRADGATTTTIKYADRQPVDWAFSLASYVAVLSNVVVLVVATTVNAVTIIVLLLPLLALVPVVVPAFRSSRA